MTAKNPLTKFRNRPSSNSNISSPNFSFRFNPAEEDLLEEYTASESTPLSTPVSINPIAETSKQVTSGDDLNDDQTMNNLSTSSSQSEIGSYTPQSEKSSRDASPLKESFKEYFPKVGKRSSSLDYSSDGERWTLSGIKGRIAKRIEEIGKDAPSFAGSLYRSDKQKLKESFSTNGVTDTANEHTISDGHVSKSFSSRSRSSLDVRAAIDDESSCITPVRKDRDRSLSVEEGIDCTTEVSDPVQSNAPSDFTKESSQPSKRSAVSLVTSGAQALLSRNKSPKLSSKVLPSQSSLPGDFNVSLSSLKSTPSFESEVLPAEEMEDFETWEFVNSDMAIEEKPETPLVFEKPLLSQYSNTKNRKECRYFYEKLMKSLRKYWRRKNGIGILVIFIALQFAPVSSYCVGLLTGVILSYIIGQILWIVFQTPPTAKVLEIPDYSSLPPLKIPVNSEDKESTICKGWMNELLNLDYDPENYHSNCTQSVYVRLDGMQLRLSRPKVNVPKRAMWNEPKINAVFVRQRHFNIKGAKVSLLPEGLARKRLWSKKYPICLVIPSQSSTLGSASSWPVFQPVVDEEENSTMRAGTYSEDEKSSRPSNIIYLFARTCREKEEWYRRFQAAAAGKTLIQFQTDYCLNILSNQKNEETVSVEDEHNENKTASTDNADIIPGPGDYLTYMASFMTQEQVVQNVSNFRNSTSLSTHFEGDKPNIAKEITSSDLWLNALIGRIFYDFLTYSIWSKVISDKIQKKLSVIKVPYFMDELKVRDIDLGRNLPFLQRSSPPMLDEKGLWIDFDLTYKGSFQMTLETKLNLMRLKKDLSVDKSSPIASSLGSCPEDLEVEISSRTLHSSKSFNNSDEEDSAESSSDDDLSYADTLENTTEDGSPSVPSSPSLSSSANRSSTSKKLLHWVDKIAQSRYFQQATEIGYIKKAMAEVSKTPIILTVELKGLVGTLVLNIPPPPSDRLWYGFRGNPQLSLTARPKLGEHVVTITHVTEWIEKKLRLEFQKLLVMPNMDDLIIPIMESGL